MKRKQYLYYHNFIKGNEDQKRYYKSYSNTLTHLKELSKKLYFKNKLTNIQGNIKETWKIIYQIVKIRSKGSITPDKINNNGVEFDQAQDIANQFNIFFRDIGPQLAEKISPFNKDFREYLTPWNSHESFSLHQQILMKWILSL